MWIVVFGVVLFAFLLLSANNSGQSATYRPMSTPSVIEQANRDSIQLVVESLGGIATPVANSSMTMVEDALGKDIGGGEGNRETESSSTMLVPRWPFVAGVTAWGWGTPAGSYRLDVETVSPAALIDYTKPTVARGIAVDEVAGDRARLESVFDEVLTASRLEGMYDAGVLAAEAEVNPSWRGDGVVTAAVLLPQTPRVAKEGSLVVELGRDWQVESFNVWTDDTFAFQDAINPQQSTFDMNDLYDSPVPEIEMP